MSKMLVPRLVYIKAPKEMNMDKENIFKVLKPVYGVPRAPIHWFKTFIDYHKRFLRMSQTAFDSCHMFARTAEGL